MRPKRFRRPSRRGERGSATVVAAWMIIALLAATGAGAYLGSAVVARHRAQAVADLAALAGAARVTSGADAACAGAAGVARRMRVDDIGCAVDGLDVVV
ncbi:Rv3654c family TadE-like protein, partial [Mycobacterium colombiense]|uniref:Rv3654c family TadE-like protein n=1 Tax=Mycobacterium colombiense TaxID=339268 RepID=UPI0022AB710B